MRWETSQKVLFTDETCINNKRPSINAGKDILLQLWQILLLGALRSLSTLAQRMTYKYRQLPQANDYGNFSI